MCCADCAQDADASYLHYKEDGTLDTSKASARLAIQEYKKKEKERQQMMKLQQQQPSKLKPQQKPNMIEGSRLGSLKELTESPASFASEQHALPDVVHTALAPAAVAHGADAPSRYTASANSTDAYANSIQDSRRASVSNGNPVGLKTNSGATGMQNDSDSSSKTAHLRRQSALASTARRDATSSASPTEASAAAASAAVPSSALLAAGRNPKQEALSTAASLQPKPSSPAAALRVHATGQHAAEISGVYQKTGERVNGYPLYKKKDES